MKVMKIKLIIKKFFKKKVMSTKKKSEVTNSNCLCDVNNEKIKSGKIGVSGWCHEHHTDWL